MKYNCEACKDTGEIELNGLRVGCRECCEHKYDLARGYMCEYCDEQGDIGSLIDAAEYRMGDR